MHTQKRERQIYREEENMRRDQVVWFGGLIRLRVRSPGNPDTKTCQVILIGFEKEERIEVKRIKKTRGENSVFFFTVQCMMLSTMIGSCLHTSMSYAF